MVDEAKIESIRARLGIIGVVEYNGHTIVFRKPSRENVRDYRRKRESESERADAMEQLAQVTVVAFDDIDDPNAARTRFTGEFLERYPMAISNAKFASCLSALAGLIEVEDHQDLGKGVSVKSGPPKPSPTV